MVAVLDPGKARVVPEQSGIVVCALYGGGRRLRDLGIDEVGTALAAARAQGDASFVWIGLYEPDAALMDRLREMLGLHELPVEDVVRAHQRTKLEEYDGMFFLALRTARWDEAEDWLDLGETHLFVGPGLLVTVRHGSASPYGEVRRRCEEQPERLSLGVAFALYAILDHVVDGFFPVLERLEDRADEIEASLFDGHFDEEANRRIFGMRTQLSSIKRAMVPLADALERVMRPQEQLVGAAVQPYLRDVHDHAVRIAETVEHLRDVLGSAVEANLAMVQVRQNEITKRLASWAALVAVPTLVAGIYGMNFTYLPFLESRLGPVLVIATTLMGCGYLYTRFKASGWL